MDSLWTAPGNPYRELSQDMKIWPCSFSRLNLRCEIFEPTHYFVNFRFKDMIRMIQSALENGTFPNYFSWDINILEGNSIDSMQQTARYLKQIIDRNEFHTLL